MPVGADRAALQSRRAELGAGLTRSEPRDIVERVARLFMRFPSSRLPDDVAKATLAAYAHDLALFPLWAIDTAFLAVIAGQADTSKAFAPSSIELRKACEKAMQPVYEELAELTRILNAEVYREPTPDEKARVQALFDDLRDELKMNVDPRDDAAKAGRRVLTRAEADAALERAKANPSAPPMSDALRARLGLRVDEVAE